jgi:hypothetical protein
MFEHPMSPILMTSLDLGTSGAARRLMYSLRTHWSTILADTRADSGDRASMPLIAFDLCEHIKCTRDDLGSAITQSLDVYKLFPGCTLRCPFAKGNIEDDFELVIKW